MKSKTSAVLIIILILSISLVGSVLLSNERQDQRGSAYFSGTGLSIQPDQISERTGDEFSVQLYAQPKSGGKVDFVETKICFGDGVALADEDPKAGITLGDGFTEIRKAVVDDNNCLDLAVSSIKPKADLPGGEAVKVAALKLKGVAEGNGTIDINKEASLVSGPNPNLSSRDFGLEIGDVVGSSYVIGEGSGGGGGDIGGSGPTLNFKVASNKLDKDPKCGKTAVLAITVLGSGTTRTYNNVEAVWNNGVYKVTKVLSDFPSSKNLAVFLKSSKSLQVKYGKDNQTAAYNKAGGEIDLSDSDKVYNFSGYPLLVGDVTGENGKQDGMVNGLDFSYVKTKASKREKVDEGGNLDADLDGNCLVNSLDTTALMLSLEEKLDQLY